MLSLEVRCVGADLVACASTNSDVGVDQRKLFTAAKEWLPKIGYRQVSNSLPQRCSWNGSHFS